MTQHRTPEQCEQAEELIAELRARLSHVEAERDAALMAASVNRAMLPDPPVTTEPRPCPARTADGRACIRTGEHNWHEFRFPWER